MRPLLFKWKIKRKMVPRIFLMITVLLMSAVVQAEVENIDNTELKALLAAGIPVIDIRRPEEWRQTGVVKGSHLLTFFDKKGNYDLRTWMDEFSKIAGPDDQFVLICRTGNRTGTISKFLDQKLKYRKVSHVNKGITHWIKKGNPTVSPGI